MLIQRQPKGDMLLTISSPELFHCAESSQDIVLAEEEGGGEGKLSSMPAGGRVRIESEEENMTQMTTIEDLQLGKRNQGDKMT